MRPAQIRQLARRIISHEHPTERTPPAIAASAVRIYMRLLARLSAVLGETGSVALFRRSLRLTEAPFPFFSAARHADLETSLSAISTCLQTQRAEVAQEASVELLAMYIELLTTFIGPRLTEQLLREAWPHLPTSASEENHA